MTDFPSSPAPGSLLEHLIAPLGVEEFFAEYYERRWFRSGRPSAAIRDLLGIDRIDQIIAETQLPASSLRMVKGGKPIPPGDYLSAKGRVDQAAVLDNFRDGATIVLPHLHHADGGLQDFCLSLESEFGARVQTNIYLTPGGEQGFDIHFDDHDVFILQVSGHKTWEIYRQREELPFLGERFRRDQDDTGELQASFVLEEGECLYVPRGLAHRAMTPDKEPSLHITVGILAKTWADFMLEAVAEASLRVPRMRQALPRELYFDEDLREAHAQTFAELLAAIAGNADFDKTLEVFRRNFIGAQKPRVRGALSALAGGIAPDDRFRRREHVLYSIEQIDGEAELVIGNSQIPLAADLAGQLAARLEAGDLAIADFEVADGDDLRDIIGTLVACGLLVPMDAGLHEKRPGYANAAGPEVLGEDA